MFFRRLLGNQSKEPTLMNWRLTAKRGEKGKSQEQRCFVLGACFFPGFKRKQDGNWSHFLKSISPQNQQSKFAPNSPTRPKRAQLWRGLVPGVPGCASLRTRGREACGGSGESREKLKSRGLFSSVNKSSKCGCFGLGKFECLVGNSLLASSQL